MVRINLLPQKREQRRAAGEGNNNWMYVLLGVVLFQGLALVFVHSAKADELGRALRENQKIQSQIDDIKRQTAAHAEVRDQLKLLRDREEAIQKLQGARSGPTRTLFEVSRILTPGMGPTADRDMLEQLKRDNPGAAPNVNWDPHRLWLTDFVEENHTVKISGRARDGEDVSEFLRRLTLSEYFDGVALLPATKVRDKSGVEVVKWELSAKVKY